MTAPLRDTGIGLVGEIPWGTHFCHFFETPEDLLDTVLPFFRAGLEANEFCLWMVEDPLTEEKARNALSRVVPGLDRFVADGSIEIHAAREWYLSAGAIDLQSLMGAWDDRIAQAVDRGFTGMRATGSVAWLQDEHWRDFTEYEDTLNQWIAPKRILVCCSYPLAAGRASAILDVARTHSFAMAKRNGSWEVLETVDEELRARNRRQSAVAALGQTAIRSRDLAALLNEATALSAETLVTDSAALGEWLPDEQGLRMHAGVGWTADLAGSTVAVHDASMTAYMLRSDEPVVVADARAESRFPISRMALAQGVLSAMGVVVRSGSRPWGVLAVHSKRPRSFGPDEVGFLQSVANVLSLAIERHEVEVAQRRERETLQAIFDNIPVMISFYDPSGGLLRVNREWERTLGWTAEEAQHLDILTEAYPDPERRKEVLEFIQKAESRWVDFRPRTRDGRIIETSWARFALSDGLRIGLGLDITERKRAEEDRTRLLESERGARADAEAALERLRAIQSITDAAFSRLGLDDLLHELLARLRSMLRAEVASVRLVDEERKDLYARAIDGIPLEQLAGIRIPLDAVHLDAPYLSNQIEPPAPGRNDWYGKAWSALNMPLRAAMTTPLLVEGKPIGIVGVTSTRAPFTEDDLHLLQVVADRVAPAIERGRLVETVRDGREQLKALSRRLLTAQEEERRRLAVELHDELGQVLTAVKINLASLERQAVAAPAAAQLRDAIASVDGAMERVRDLALDLRPSVLDDLGLPAAVRWYADRFARSTRVKVHLSIEAVPHLPPELETACFRVAQEALTNVARHAQATNVWVDLRLVAEALDLTIHDDGIGFDAPAARERAIGGASLGLLGMQQRVSLLGGEYALKARPGGGTEVHARFRLGETGRVSP